MTPELIAAAVRLADTLAAENAALAALDLPRACAMLDDKTRAADAFLAARALAARQGEPAAAGRAAARDLAGRLRDLAEENRRLLERALVVQSGVIGVIASAVPRAQARAAGGYGANGGIAARRAGPVAICARA